MSGFKDDEFDPSVSQDNPDEQYDDLGDIDPDLYDDEIGGGEVLDVETDEVDDHNDQWDDELGDVVAQSEEETDKPKKKSSLLTYVIIGVMVLAAGAFGLSKLGGDPQPGLEGAEAPQPDAAEDGSLAALRDEANMANANPQPAPETPDEPESSAPQGFMNETPEPPPVAEAPPGLQAVPDSAPPSEALPGAELPVPGKEEPAAPVLALPKPVSDFPSVEQIKKADTADKPAEKTDAAEPAPTAEATPPAPLTTPETPSESSEAAEPGAEKDLQDKLAASEKKTASLEKELAQAKEELTEQAAKGESTIKDLRAQIASLEKQVDGSSDALPTPAVVRPKPSPAAKQPKSSSVKTSARSAAPVTAAVSGWELRGAQPGQAMLARKGGGDLRTVGVGDTLAGLGKVLSIEQSPQGWVVTGTQGRVSQ